MKSPGKKRNAPKAAARRKEAAPVPVRVARNGRFPMVCVGASAGGLEAFVQLLENLPPDLGMAYILVQHLDPRHESMLAGIISRSTVMPVVEVKDGMRVKPNHVYVIPPNVDMAILHGTLSLMPRPSTRGPHLAIDYFLRSLARDQKDQAIAVILSGTASDGAQGVKEIKGEAGITFAQDEKSAKYPGMPLSAIATGTIDFVLPPKEIARELVRIGRHPYLTVRRPPELRTAEPEGDEETNKVYILIRDAIGVDFTLYKQTMMRRRIQRRMLLHKLDRIKDYIRYLQGNPSEVMALYQDFLINVSSFFRDSGTFQALKKRVIPALLKGRTPSSPLRIWVAGCSTGEEVYSIGILLKEAMGGTSTALPIQVFGTDIDDRSIERARFGVYPDSIAEDVSPERLRRYFVESDHGYQVSKSIRDMCVFARQNLVKDPPFSKMDLISCRNVLIYMKPALQRKVLSIFHYALKPAGYLLLGTSESVGELADLYRSVDRQNKIYIKKDAATRAHGEFAVPALPIHLAEHARGTEDFPPRSLEKVHRDADRIALDRYAPAGVLVNEQLAILQFRGQIDAYLTPAPGRASLSLLRMAREGLAPILRKAVEKAKTAKRPVRSEKHEIRHEGKVRRFDLEVVPIPPVPGSELFFLILFVEPDRKPAAAAVSAVSRAAARPRGTREPHPGGIRAAELEGELASMKEYVRTILSEQETNNEAIRAASEEVQSSNEELQSTNEELETAKEELQSTNEELTTLNEEMTNRNLELSSAYNDLANLLASVNIPILIVEADLRIRRITPAAEKTLGLIPTDVGRPLRDLNLSIQVPDLEKKVQAAIDSVTSSEEEAQGRDGNWYLVRIKPYTTPERKIEGALLSFLDISRLRLSMEKLAQALQYCQAIVDTTRESVMVLDTALRVQTVNRAFCETFQTSREEAENRPLEEVGKGVWNVPDLRKLLLENLPRRLQIQDFPFEAEFPKVGRKVLRVDARWIPPIEGEAPILVVSIDDRTSALRVGMEAEKKNPPRSAATATVERKKTSR